MLSNRIYFLCIAGLPSVKGYFSQAAHPRYLVKECQKGSGMKGFLCLKNNVAHHTKSKIISSDKSKTQIIKFSTAVFLWESSRALPFQKAQETCFDLLSVCLKLKMFVCIYHNFYFSNSPL